MVEENDWTEKLRDIIRRMTEADVTELEVRHADLRIKVRRQSGDAEAGGTDPSLRLRGGDLAASAEPGPELHRVTAPLTGIYYAAPNPSAKPYVEAGDWVQEGTVLGLIETMKVFNEVTAECTGRVESILAEQGQLVQAGEPLVLIDTGAVPDSSEEVAQ